jgi:hypothetical protein
MNIDLKDWLRSQAINTLYKTGKLETKQHLYRKVCSIMGHNSTQVQ